MAKFCSQDSLSNFRTGFLVTFLIFVSSSEVQGFFGEWGADLEGPWCATRPPGEDCCVGRDDFCTVPILGTECYCDIFCNETAHDCCPDYWKHCHGYVGRTTQRTTTLPPPRTTRPYLSPCTRNGGLVRPGETIYDNCNNCTCDLYEVPFRRYDLHCTQNVCLLRPELIEAVNDNPSYTWRASNYSNLWGLTLDEGVRYRLGTFQLADNVVDMTPIRVEDDVLPESFDARDKWPNLLHPITDQGNCASSWAHSTTAVASDRLSIETEGAIKDSLSAQHLLSCDIDGQLGCNGGHLDRAWWFLRRKGVVAEECYPYTSGATGNQGQCLITGDSDQTGQECPSGIQYKTDKRYQATPPYRIRPIEREIMKEVMDNGPVQATLRVREDFFMYSRGVYQYSKLTFARGESEEHMKSGFHSVRIIGWGAERTPQGDIVKYWICANSWGPAWGENGYFRILRGVDESNIESYVIGVWGKVTGDPALHVLLSENRRRRMRYERARKRRHLRQLRSRDELQRRRNRRHHHEGEEKMKEMTRNKKASQKKHKLKGNKIHRGHERTKNAKNHNGQTNKHNRQQKHGKESKSKNTHHREFAKMSSHDILSSKKMSKTIADKILYDYIEPLYK